MKITLPRFTLRRLMLAVALSTVLIPFPISMTLFVGSMAGAFLVADFVLGWCIHWMVESHPIGFAASALICVIAVIFVLIGPGPSNDVVVIALIFAGLTVANAAGPFYVARRIRRGEPLAGGHLLWGWSALIWFSLFLQPLPARRGAALSAMVECARLTFVVAVLLVIYGKRPVGKLATEAHFAGWILVEFNVIAWGWYASTILR